MDPITEHELLVSRGLRSRVFARARVLFPVFYPEIEIGTLESFDYIPGVAGLEGKIYVTFQEGDAQGPHAIPAKFFIGNSDAEAVKQAEEFLEQQLPARRTLASLLAIMIVCVLIGQFGNKSEERQFRAWGVAHGIAVTSVNANDPLTEEGPFREGGYTVCRLIGKRDGKPIILWAADEHYIGEPESKRWSVYREIGPDSYVAEK